MYTSRIEGAVSCNGHTDVIAAATQVYMLCTVAFLSCWEELAWKKAY